MDMPIIMVKFYRFQVLHLKMKHLSLFVILNTNIFLVAQGNWFNHVFEVTKSDCGNTEPSDISLWSKRKRSYFSNKTIYIYKSDKCIDSMRTDSMGRVSIKLRPGKYSFYLPYKHFK